MGARRELQKKLEGDASGNAYHGNRLLVEAIRKAP